MTMLAVPIPPPASRRPSTPVRRVSDGYLIRRCLAAIWLMVLAHFLAEGSWNGWWAVVLYGVPGGAFISYGVRHEWFPEHDEQPTGRVTTWTCCLPECGQERRIQDLVNANGALICREHVRKSAQGAA